MKPSMTYNFIHRSVQQLGVDEIASHVKAGNVGRLIECIDYIRI